ncbi:MAG: leucine-rich repeat protein [Opitutaceae bacterium]|nr:leucine-rich repeat protein [Opitutaceae bacterium]
MGRFRRRFGGRAVVAIGPAVFKNRSSYLAAQTMIPAGVTAIGDEAFSGCDGLVVVSFPASIVTIGNSAFADCPTLKVALFEGAAPTIGDAVFAGAAEAFAIRHKSGASGFTAPHWFEYKCRDQLAPTIVTQWSTGRTGEGGSAEFRVTALGFPAPSFQWQKEGVDLPGETGPTLTLTNVRAEQTGHYRVVVSNSLGTVAGDTATLSLFSDGLFTYIVNGDSATITGCTLNPFSFPYELGLAIPANIGGRPVKAIGPHSFTYPLETGPLSIPAGVTTIGEYAFGGLGVSGELTLPSSVTTIGRGAFGYCRGFSGPLMIPGGVSIIEDNTFQCCAGLTGDLMIPGGVTSIGDSAFAGCSGLTIATFPAGIRAIRDRAFENCTATRSAHFLGDAPETFGDAVFAGTAADFAVYYRRGAAGFTTPLWHGYPCVEESAPSIRTQPVDQEVVECGAARFTVAVAGGPAPTIQWQRNGADLPGETRPTLSLPYVQATQAGSYRAVVSNSLGTAVSTSVLLAVNPTPVPIIEEVTEDGWRFEGYPASLSVRAVGAKGYQWCRNGRPISGATGSTLTWAALSPSDAGFYDCVLTGLSGNTISAPILVGLWPNGRVSVCSMMFPPLQPGDAIPPEPPYTAGSVTTKPEWQNMAGPEGKVYDQFLLTGLAGTFSADYGQIARLSFLDLNGSIVQVELSGQGAITVVLEEGSATGPTAPVLYAQAGVQYMKGKATIVLAGADETTHFTIYSVGTANNPGVTLPGVVYDGWVDVSAAGIVSWDRKLGGIHLGNADFNSSLGYTGIYAPTVASVGGVVVVHGINSSGSALPYLHFAPGGAVQVKIAGSSLYQASGDSISTAGLAGVQMGAGQDSCGRPAPAAWIRTRLIDPDGTDVTAAVVTGP